VTALQPFSGPVTGSTNITITGVGFVDTSEIVVQFGSELLVHGTFVDESHIVCVSPPINESGSVTVNVALNGQQFTADDVSFLYYGIIIMVVW